MTFIKKLLIISIVLFGFACSKKETSRSPAQAEPDFPYVTSEGYKNENGSFLVPTSSTIYLSPTYSVNSLTQFKAENLPPGLSINSSTGVISGSISVPGTYYSKIYVYYSGILKNTTAHTFVAETKSAPTSLVYEQDIFNLQKNQLYALKPINPNGSFLEYSAIGLPYGFNINTRTGEISGVYLGVGGSFTPLIKVYNTLGTVFKQITINFDCESFYTNVNGVCMIASQTRACTAQPAHSTGGIESSTDGGQSWGTCSSFTCNALYSKVGNICVLSSQTRSCLVQPLNSIGGTEASSDGGQTWGACSGYTCDASSTNVAGICELTNQTRSCVGQPANSTGGIETSSDGGQTWGSCLSFTCNALYTNINGIASKSNAGSPDLFCVKGN